jgi:hypothetical protein
LGKATTAAHHFAAKIAAQKNIVSGSQRRQLDAVHIVSSIAAHRIVRSERPSLSL